MSNVSTRQFTGTNYWAVVSIAFFLIAGMGFWYWIYQYPLFAFGFVAELIEAPESNTIAILELFGQPLYAVALFGDLPELEPGQWLFVYGAEFDIQAKLLIAESWHHNGVLDTVLKLLSEHWIEQFKAMSVLALGVAGVLVLTAGRSFRWLYLVAITLLLSVTTWHALLAAEFLGLMPVVKPLERNIILGMVGLYCFITTRRLKGDDLPAQLAALVLALLVGKSLVAYFGLGENWAYLLMVVALFFPAVLAAVLAAFLMGTALDVSVVGSYLVLLLCMVLSLGAVRQRGDRLIMTHLLPPARQHYKGVKQRIGRPYLSSRR